MASLLLVLASAGLALEQLLALLPILGLGAVVSGGVFGIYRNSIGGVTFSTWRGIQTARQKTSPSNPKTPDQQENRTFFGNVVSIIQRLGPGLYRSEWNNAVGTLPGFQSLMKVLLSSLDHATGTLETPDPVNLGSIPAPTAVLVESNNPGQLTISYGIPAGDPLPVDTEIVGFAYPRLMEAVDSYIPTPERGDWDDESMVFNGLDEGVEYNVGIYFVGGATDPGNCSPCVFVTGTVSSE